MPKPMASKLESSKVLALRGGGMIDKGTWLKAFSAFMGLYGLGFVAAPGMVIEQNFDTTYDKYHLFISRLAGLMILSLIYSFFAMDIATAFPIALVTGLVTAIAGPFYAELKLETKPAHKAALLMIPLLITGAMAI